jgi:hypothetical protein
MRFSAGTKGSEGSRPTLTGQRRRLGRRWRRVLVSLLTVVLVFAAATAWVLVWPPQGMPSQVSAIVLLAGPGDRMPVALKLASEHRAPVLVVSQGSHGYGGPCPPRPPGVKVICFDPSPPTTQGEAEYVGKLARQYRWSSVVLVVSQPQATRARILMGRCFGGPVYVTTGRLPAGAWPYQIAYGWGALIKALTAERSC